MRNSVYILSLFICLSACAASNSYSSNSKYTPRLKDQQTFVLEGQSTDDSYGYSQKNPVMVGGVLNSEGPLNERRFLNALTGPNGEPVSYERIGSCCEFETKNSPFGSGMLDEYQVSYNGLAQPITLYINMYDSDSIKAPVGFNIKQ